MVVSCVFFTLKHLGSFEHSDHSCKNKLTHVRDGFVYFTYRMLKNISYDAFIDERTYLCQYYTARMLLTNSFSSLILIKINLSILMRRVAVY